MSISTLKNAYYSFFGDLDVVQIAKRHKIDVTWILEAGCHDGSDSIELFEQLKPTRYLAFEPDKVARLKAEKSFKVNQLSAIELYPVGLSNENSVKFLKYEAEGEGSGSTHFSDKGTDQVKICRFDECFTVNESLGLLWLDVEGHAIQALEGMTDALRKIVIARIEIQLHTRNEDFEQDFIGVIHLMKQASLVPIFGPIYPGYFGDIIFLRAEFFTWKDKIRSKLLLFHLKTLHLYIYPKLNKPSPIT
jgi:FkbM family methyltransferase